MAKALDDVIVLDLTQVLAGPFAVTILADFGADVIQIEPVGGDYGRRLFSTYNKKLMRLDNWNTRRNRRGMSLNLRSQKGKEIFLELVKKADVVVQNFSPGAMERLGLGYDVMKEANPGIIYCAMSGYGQTGPAKDQLAYDGRIQADSGLMSMTGFPENPPVKVGIPVADYAGATYAVIGILLALHYKERTGKGQMVDAAMFDAICKWTVGEIRLVEMSGKDRNGNHHPMVAPSGVYETKDNQYISYGAQTDAQWESFLKLVGKEEFIAEKWDYSTRLQRNDEIEPWAKEWARSKTLEEAMRELTEARLVGNGITRAIELETNPQVLEREMYNVVDDPECGEIKGVVGVTPKLSETPGSIGTAQNIPELSQHTEEILSELLGYSKKEISKLKEEGVV